MDSFQFEDVKVSLRSGLAGDDWRDKGDRVLSILAAAEKPVVVFFDEVPILVNRLLKGSDYQITPERRQQTDAFMSWLRDNSIRHQGKVRFVVTGSIGLAPILQQAGLSATINHFKPFDLPPWTAETAIACLQALANQYDLIFRPRAKERIVERLGICIPYHVQMFFDHLYRKCKLERFHEISPTLVDAVYEQEMLSTRGHAELSHLEERLKQVLSSELYALALDFLTEAAVTDTLTADATKILATESLLEASDKRITEVTREILGILEHDGYLKREGQSYQFVSLLVKDWWKSRYDFGYIPAGERKR